MLMKNSIGLIADETIFLVHSKYYMNLAPKHFNDILVCYIYIFNVTLAPLIYLNC